MGVNKVVFGAVSIIDITDSTVTADTLAKGATAYDKAGDKITGTMEAKVDPVLQTKTVTPTTSSQSVTPDTGYDGLSKVTVNAMPTATQATPSISVDSAGKITASATQSAGYVSAGTKSATKQLTTQGAKTITPSTSTQTAVASGRYTTGAVTVAPIPSSYVKPTATKGATTYTPSTSNQTIASGTYCSGVQTIKGDANLVAGNIKSGVSIFGVSGSYEGSGGSGGGSVETCTVKIEPFGFDPQYERISTVSATIIENNSRKTYFYKTSDIEGTHTAITIPNVECGSTISVTLKLYNNFPPYVETNGTIEIVYAGKETPNSFEYSSIIVFRAPTGNGEEGTLQFSYEP